MALWRFDGKGDHALGANSGSGDGDLSCAGGHCRQQPAGLVDGGADSVVGRMSPSLSIGGGAHLSFASDGLPQGVPVGNADYTVTGWVLASPAASGDNSSGMQGVVGWGDWATVNGSTAFATQGDSQFWSYWFSTGATSASVDMLFAAPGFLVRWSHFACRWNSATATKTCFWDGKLAAEAHLLDGHAARSGGFGVGTTHRAEYFTGLLDDVAIFDRALGDDEVVRAALGDFAEGGGLCLSSFVPPPAPPPPTAPTVAMSTEVLALGVGVLAEATIDCSGGNAATRGGLVAGAPAGNGTAFIWDCATQVMTVGTLRLGAGSGAITDASLSFVQVASWDRTTRFDYATTNGTVVLRLLLKKPELSSGMGSAMMSEFYVNDVMAHPYSYKAVPGEPVHLGIVALAAGEAVKPARGSTGADAVVTDVKAWRMTLPYM